jgi:hypothetical protein
MAVSTLKLKKLRHKMTFTTQKQIWEHLIANEGKPCLITKSDKLVGLKDGLIYNFTVNEKQDLYFYTPSDWQPYTEPEPCWLQKRIDEVMRPLTLSEDAVVKYQMGAEQLAHEAIRRIETIPSEYTHEMYDVGISAAVRVLKELIGDSDGK